MLHSLHCHWCKWVVSDFFFFKGRKGTKKVERWPKCQDGFQIPELSLHLQF